MSLHRRVSIGAASTIAVLLALTGCAGPEPGSADSQPSAGTNDVLTIGISQFVQHPALDAATAGFKQSFLDAGYIAGDTVVFDEHNANAEVATAATIAQGFGTDAAIDLAIGVGTQSTQAMVQTVTEIPVLFAAVTDPVAADVVETVERPGGNVTGVSDMNPVADQIALIAEILPDASSVGIVYGSGEVNSEVQVDLAKAAAKQHGLTIVEATATNVSEIPQAAASLGDVDAIYVPTDNLVVSALATVIGYAEDHGITVVGADSTHVEGGAVATVGINYEKLGIQAGEMALRILEDGADPASTPVEYLSELELVVNLDAAKRMGVSVPPALVKRADRVID